MIGKVVIRRNGPGVARRRHGEEQVGYGRDPGRIFDHAAQRGLRRDRRERRRQPGPGWGDPRRDPELRRRLP